MTRSLLTTALALSLLALPAAADDRSTPEYVARQLEETEFTFQGEDVPFEDVIQVVREVAEVNVVVDSMAYRALDLEGGDLKVNVNVRNLKMKNALRLILALNGLESKYACGAVVVSTPELLKRFPEEPAGPPAGADPESRETHERLRDQVLGNLQFEAHPLAEVIEFVRDNFALNLVIDPDLVRAGEPRITFRIQDVSLAQALTLMLGSAGLEMAIESGIVVVRKGPDPLAPADECPFCGKKRDESWKFCPGCGRALRR